MTRKGRPAQWNIKRAKETLGNITLELGHFPSDKELRERHLGSLAVAISRYFGGFYEMRKEMGFSDKKEKQKGYWLTIDNVLISLSEVREEIGHFPSGRELQKLGRYDLFNAIQRHHGGFRKIRAVLGEEQAKIETGKWMDFDYAAQEALRFMREEGYETLPGADTINKRYRSLGKAISTYHGGFPSFRQRLNEYLKRESNEAGDSLLEVYVGGQQ